MFNFNYSKFLDDFKKKVAKLDSSKKKIFFNLKIGDFEKDSVFLSNKEKKEYCNFIENYLKSISEKDYFMSLAQGEYLLFFEEGEKTIEDLEKDFLGNLYRPIVFNNKKLNLFFYVGSSIFLSDSDNYVTCLRYSRISRLYFSGKAYRHYSKFESKFLSSSKKEFFIKNNLINAIERKEIYMKFQPVFDLDEKIVYFEALLRWEFEGEILNPEKIISVAEENETIHKLTFYIIEYVAGVISEWKLRYGVNIPISVNVSQSDLSNPAFPEKIVSTLDKYNLESKDLILEITETIKPKFFSSIYYDKVTPVLVSNKLHELGFKLYADDFGTILSNLDFVTQHQLSGIKIDKYFISELLNRKEYFSRLISGIVDFSSYENRLIVCEGVENQTQLEILKSLDKKILIQGYLLSRPLVKEDIEKNYFK